MNKYVVKLYARAYRDLDGIYTYIAENLLEPDTALNMADELESAIFSLEQLPERGAVRRAGAYANGNYRQLFVKNYTEKTAPKRAVLFRWKGKRMYQRIKFSGRYAFTLSSP